MKERVKKVSIPEINESLANIENDSERFIDKSFEIANLIMQYMKENDWYQKDLAEKMGKSEPEISKLLSGTHNYTLRTLSKIEAVFNKDLVIVANKSFDKLITDINKGGKVVKMSLVAYPTRGEEMEDQEQLNVTSSRQEKIS